MSSHPAANGRGGHPATKKEDMRQKFMDSAAKEAGKQTVEVFSDGLKEGMQPMIDSAHEQIDDAKAQALAEIDAAKAQALAAKQRAQDEIDEKKKEAQDALNAEKAQAQQEIADMESNFFSKLCGCLGSS